MPSDYRHTQIGYLTLSFLIIASAFCFVLYTFYDLGPTPERILWSAGVVTLILALLFASLTVQVDDQSIKIHFGFGLIRRTIPLSNVQSTKVVSNPFYYGWGLRLTPHGWLWNVSGFGAVELQYKNGKKFRIGSDEPEALNQALQQNLK